MLVEATSYKLVTMKDVGYLVYYILICMFGVHEYIITSNEESVNRHLMNDI